MPRSLVTGAAGFIGSHVARYCLELGHEVVAIDDLSGGFTDNLPEGVDFQEGSVSDAAFVNALFERDSFDFVYHLAAYAAEGLSHFIRRFNYLNNVVGSVNVLNGAIRSDVQRFVFTSSIAVYGANQVPMTEELVPAPEDPYGVAKYAVELDLRSAHEMFGIDYTVFRPHNVYGEHQNIGDRYRNVVGIFMNQVMQGRPLSVFGDGLQSRAFSYIDDVAPIIAGCVEVPDAANEVFNVGADQATTVLELAQMVARAFDATPEIDHLPARNEVVHAFASHERCRAVFGHADTVPLEEGIRRMAAWARQQGPRRTQSFGEIEVWRNLPEVWRQDVERTR